MAVINFYTSGSWDLLDKIGVNDSPSNFLVSFVSTYPNSYKTITTASSLVIEHTGKFTYAGAQPSSGRISQINLTYDNITEVTITGLKADLASYCSRADLDLNYYLDEYLYNDNIDYGNNTLSYLFSGKDTFNGGSGNDVIPLLLWDSAGADTLYGNSGDDYLTTNFTTTKGLINGGSGSDYLQSYGQRDTLTGGSNNDYFVIQADKSVVITDLSIEEDYLNINVTGAQWELYATDLSSLYLSSNGQYLEFYESQVLVGNYSAAQDYNDFLIYNNNSGRLYFDPDGYGGDASILIATLKNKPQLDVADIANDLVVVTVTGVVEGGLFDLWLP
jgi:hypothetical protein